MEGIKQAMFGACSGHLMPIDLQQGQGQGQDIDSLAGKTLLKEVKLLSLLSKTPAAGFLLQAFLAFGWKPHWLLLAN